MVQEIQEKTADVAEILPLDIILFHMRSAYIFCDCLKKFDNIFKTSGGILELGAGPGWASCIVKRLYPHAYVTATDISAEALKTLPEWEHIFKAKLDKSYACRSDQIPEKDGSQSCIFAYAAAHHFGTHQQTLQEIFRVLCPGGNCFYFYDTSCRAIFYPFARWHAHRQCPNAHEDVLIYKKMQKIAKACGFQSHVTFYPNIFNHSTLLTMYFLLLKFLPFLRHLLPCSTIYHFQKPATV